ncbi:replication protein ['Chrysanthemum coronarium' phytoplasma]|uniref:Replication protein n=1 Tax='Chrysanthemum coronarium' phytoplasma TaxID=1520703 RepID=A0ABQ0J3K1_9MOLU|nr:replication protein ['Chrysanthemum coronarium' phytoplasma]
MLVSPLKILKGINKMKLKVCEIVINSNLITKTKIENILESKKKLFKIMPIFYMIKIFIKMIKRLN